MARQCVHGKPLNECPICKHVRALLNHNTMIATRAHIISVGTRNPNFNRSMNLIRLSQLSDSNATRRVNITPAIRNAANAYTMNPSMRTAAILREGLLIAMTPNNELLNFDNTGSYNSTSRVSTRSARFSRSALSVYSRLGTPNSPTMDRRARSQTPVSRLRPRSPSDSNKNDEDRFSPKRVRKS
jgi:hypothetical protein